MTFTSAQWQSLAIVPHFTSALSMMGDSWIILDILVRRKKQTKLPLTSYHRIILFMSIWDFVVLSLGKFPGSWAMPRDGPGAQPDAYYAMGTRQTCTMQGFFIQFSLVVPLYNALTALYYLLVIHLGWGNKKIQKYEKWMHICPFVIALSFATVGLVPSMSLYSSSSLWCWMNAEPKGCIQSYAGNGQTTCDRGDNAFVYGLALYYGPIVLCIIFAAVSMMIIFCTVRKQEKRVEAFYLQNNQQYDAGTTLNGKQLRRHNRKRKEIAGQAYTYIGGFMMIWTFPILNRTLRLIRGQSFFPIMLLHSIFSPLQGFVNFIVYMRPRFIQHIAQHKKLVADENASHSNLVMSVAGFFFFASEKKQPKKRETPEGEVKPQKRTSLQGQNERDENESPCEEADDKENGWKENSIGGSLSSSQKQREVGIENEENCEVHTSQSSSQSKSQRRTDDFLEEKGERFGISERWDSEEETGMLSCKPRTGSLNCSSQLKKTEEVRRNYTKQHTAP